MTDEQLIGLLREHEISPTPQRIAIARILLPKPRHMSADDIISEVRHRSRRVSKATVYNTLNLFVERGLLKDLNIDQDRVIFDSNTAHHHHIYNMDTGELTDICPTTVEFARLPDLPTDTEPDSVQITFRVRGAA